MGIFGNKTDSFLGVDIGAHGVKLVELKKTKGRAQLWTYGIAKDSTDIHVDSQEDKTPNDFLKEAKSPHAENTQKGPGMEQKIISDQNQMQVAKYAKILKEVVAQSKAQSINAAASIPVSYVFHTVLTLPETDDKGIMPIVRAEVKKLLSRSDDEMQIIHQKIPQTDLEKKRKYIRVLVTAAPKSVVAFYTSIFQAAGLRLQELETEAFALERSLVGKDPATSMIVDIGAERTNLFIIDQGLPMTHRSIQIGGNDIEESIALTLGVEPKLAGQLKVDMSRLPKGSVTTEIFEEMLNAIVKEIQYNFDVYLHQLGNEGKHPEKIILTGGSSVMPFIIERLEKTFPMKVFVGDPWARVVYQQGLKPVLDKIGPRMGVAIGLALRNIAK